MAKLDFLKGPESHRRSVVKAVSWRIIGTLDTFLWSYLITKQAFSAGSIASLETVTKIALFYGHERLWHFVPLAEKAHLRSFLKAVSWRFVGSLDTFMLSLLVTGNAKYAVSIATAEALTKIILFYVHERVWRTVKWGQGEPQPAPGQSVGPAANAAS